jgi:Uma2 family endonuclease
MTTHVLEKTRKPAKARQAVAEPETQFIELEHVSWESYEKLLRDTEGQHVKFTYDNGRLVLMAPISPSHEIPKNLLGRMIEALTEELDIPIIGVGSATWKRKDLAKGLESDECYFIQHAGQVRKKKVWNLRRDPPPDLVVEVDVTHHPINRPAIYAALGVPELWHWEGGRVQFLKLGADKKYNPIMRSSALPMIAADDVNRYLAMAGKFDHTKIIRSFRSWVRQQVNE